MTPADLQRIRSSPGWRRSRVELFHDTSVGSVIVKGQRAQRPAWRYRLLNGLARLIRLPLLKAAPAHGGARAQRIEVDRLRRLAAAGVPVPQVLHAEDEFFVQSWLGETRLDQLLRRGDALVWWQRGLRALVDLHARDQYLSQAFARNFIARGDALAMIDFEDDPLEVMTLEQAQARDWLAFAACQRAGLPQALAGAACRMRCAAACRTGARARAGAATGVRRRAAPALGAAPAGR